MDRCPWAQGVCVSVCVHLCVCNCEHVFHPAMVIASVCWCMPKTKTCVLCVCAWHAGCWSVSGVFSGLQASLVPSLSHWAVLVEFFIKLCLEYSGHMCSAATDEPWAGGDGVCAWKKQGGDGAKPSWQRCYPAAGSCAPPFHAYTHIHTNTHTTITYPNSLALNVIVRVMFNLREEDILCLFHRKDSWPFLTYRKCGML